MKHYDVDAKKFIKNVVSLVVSAMLLIAATIAWFAQNNQATVGRVNVTVKSSTVITYSKMAVPSTAFLDTATGLVVKTRAADSTTPATSITGTAIASYVTDSGRSWSTNTTSGAWDLSDLYPGVFGAFRITYSSDGSARDLSLTFNSSIASANSDALSAVSVYALAQSTASGGTPQTLSSTSTTLAALVPSSGLSSNVLTGINASQGTAITVYYVVGIPATGGASAQQHADTIRQALVSITGVDVVVPSA